MNIGIIKHNDALDFILAGNATVTFLNTKSGNRFTYNVKHKKDKNELFFVKVLTSPEIYSYIGSIFNKIYKHSQKSKISNEAQSIKVFQYVLSKLKTNSLEDFIEIWHEGKCGRCNRQLTVPSSIESGYGPECIKLIHKGHLRQEKINKILN